MLSAIPQLPVIDFFSGAGGMSYGFHQNAHFKLIAAVDGELSKPSAQTQSTDCNSTYFSNCGVQPQKARLTRENILAVGARIIPGESFEGVLIACPPCTDFTRANPRNHSVDGSRNELTSAVAQLLLEKTPKYVVYENAREALQGNHAQHLETILHCLERLGYNYQVNIFDLNDFGVPQRRERVILIASRDTPVLGMHKLWEGYYFSRPTNVRFALNRLSQLQAHASFSDDRYPKLTSEVQTRINAIPKNGGSWTDIVDTHRHLLIPSMLKKIELEKLGSYKDVYGRMSFDEPAPTIKRECSHVGNGRYVHPLEDRHLTVAEMAFLQGFPTQFRFSGTQLSNCYRQIGDAVPPIVSYQIASLVSWMETGVAPSIIDFCLPNSSLDPAVVLSEKRVIASSPA